MKLHRAGRAAVALVAAGTVLVIALAFVPVWPCSLLPHFRVQLLFGALVIVVLACLAATRWFDGALIALLVNAVIVVPDLQRARRSARTGTAVRLLVSNVLAPNPDRDRLAALIAAERPDIVALLEPTQLWFATLATALPGYQRIEHERSDYYSIGLYVRGRVSGAIEHIGGELPTLVASVTVDGARALTFVLTHPMPPMDAAAEDLHAAQLAAIGARVRALAGPLILAGDFNATPWSPAFARLAATSGLCDTRAGFGYQGSYPTSPAILRIPIDHVLVSCAIGVRDRRIGPDIGSDHLPVIVDLVVP